MGVLSPTTDTREESKLDWESMKPVYGDQSAPAKDAPAGTTPTSQIDWSTMKEDQPKAGMPAPTVIDPIEGYYSGDRLNKAWELTGDVLRATFPKPAVPTIPEPTTPDILSKAGAAVGANLDIKPLQTAIPFGGAAIEEMLSTGYGELFSRPMAALTALAKDTPFDGSGRTGVLKTIYNGLSNPEKYPPTEMVTALTDVGMEPTSAAALATLGQFGFYLGAGEAMANVVTTGKVSLLQGAIKNIGDAIQESNGRAGAVVSLKPKIARAIAENTDLATVVDIYSKSRDIRLCRNNGTVQVLRGEILELPKDIAKTSKITATKLSESDQVIVGEIESLTKKDLKVDPRNGRNKADDIEGLIEEGSPLEAIFKAKIAKLEGKPVPTEGGKVYYHGTKEKSPVFRGQGIFLARDKADAKIFGDNIFEFSPNIEKPFQIETPLQKGMKSDPNKISDNILEYPDTNKEIIKSLKEQGYDAIVSSDGSQILLLDKSKLSPTEGGKVATPLEIEARKYNSAPFELPEDIKKYAVRRPEHIEGESLYHETSPAEAFNLVIAHQDLIGLNVSNDPTYALGQSGKGVVIEYDKASVFGDRGFARVIRKPATDLVGEKEFEIGAGRRGTVESILVKPGVKLPKSTELVFERDFKKIVNSDGSILFIAKEPIKAAAKPPAKPPVEEPPAPQPAGEDPYGKNRALKQTDVENATPIRDALSRTGRRISEEANKAFVPVSTRLAKIAEELKHASRKFEFRSRREIFADLQRTKPFLDKYAKLSIEDAADLDFALKNRDTGKVDAIIKRNGLEKEFAEVRAVLDEMHERALKADMSLGFLEDYWPRRVGDAEGFLQYLRESENWNAIDEAVKIQEEAQGYSMLPTEKADFINKLLRGNGGTGIWLRLPANVKTRLIDVIKPEMNRYYKDSSQALIDYIEGMNTAIETRRFFGKGEGAVDSSIGAYVEGLLKDGMIATEQAQTIRDILKARFNQKGTQGLWSTYKNLSYLATMNSPLNAITQIGDLAFPIYRNGYLRTGKAIFTGKLTKEDIGVHNIAQEFSGDTNTSAKAVNAVFKMIGLEKIDRIGKEVLINSSLSRLRNEATKQGEKLMPELIMIFGDEASQVLADLKNGVTSENVKYLLFSELCDFQPIALSEMPEYYLRGGNGRILYMLKSYTLKVLDVYHNEVLRQIKTDPIKGMQNFIRLTAALTLMGVTADWIKDFLLGKVGELSDYVLNNLVKTVGFNKYTMVNATKDGLISAFTQSITPPVPFVDTLFTDIMGKKDIADWKTWSKIPYVGSFYYWWFGGGTKQKQGAVHYR